MKLIARISKSCNFDLPIFDCIIYNDHSSLSACVLGSYVSRSSVPQTCPVSSKEAMLLTVSVTVPCASEFSIPFFHLSQTSCFLFFLQH